jgi:mono/diheme cytochrome c family protein
VATTPSRPGALPKGPTPRMCHPPWVPRIHGLSSVRLRLLWTWALVLLSTVLPAADDAGYAATVRPVLQTYCWQCHGAQRQKGTLNLQALATLADLTARSELLPILAKRLSDEEMPPASSKQPSAQERATLVRWLSGLIDQGHPQLAGDPGPVVIPHLTPTQYERVIHDLTGMNLPLAAELPREGGAGEGFDNVGAAQAMTTMHIQAYLTTAMQIVTHLRALPGLPLEWRNESNSIEPHSCEELYGVLASDFRHYTEYLWQRQCRDHLAALAPVLPTDDVWNRSVVLYTQYNMRWMVPYLHGAWQYQHRAELGHPDWTPADTAAAYQPPLRKEVLTRFVAVLGATSWNMYWNQLVARWKLLPPPPVSDAAMRTQCFQLMTWWMRHMYCRDHDTTGPPETDVNLPIEVEASSYLTQPGEPWFIMMNHGLHPFRFNLKGQRDLYLVTTDANDGSDDDVMIWEKGVITCNGHEQPWTVLTVTDRAGAPIAWGSHPNGPAAGLAMDSIAVHAPAVLHLTFPAGTTAFRVDARADPVYAKNGSMQAVPLLHPPSDDELHFAILRYVFGAPGSKRQKDMYNASDVVYGLGGAEVADPWNLLPPTARSRWANLHDKSIAVDWGGDSCSLKQPPPPESNYGVGGYPHGYPGDDHVWKGTSTLLLDGATDQERKTLAHIIDQLVATQEARDDLFFFLTDQKIVLKSCADALTVVPTSLGPDLTPRYHALLDAARADEQRLLGCARDQLTDFARRAWRREPDEPSLLDLLAFYRGARDEGLCYEASMKRALVGVLISPYFLYRVEPARQREAPYALNGSALADRLASVMWGSIPDAELMAAGADGRLTDPASLRQQIQRLIMDRRSQALAAEFAGQIFLFEDFTSFIGPNAARFPEFTPAIRDAMYHECLSFFGNLFQQNCPLTDIIDANYLFVNHDLAAFYGIDGVDGAAFRKITVNPSQRGGILGMGAFLVSTSLPLRTSPIRRGNWVLTHILGTPPPPPPPLVPQLSNEESDEQKLTIVQQMKHHRSDAQCMSCHERIDPLGIALETFDPIGRGRAKLPDGSPVVDQESMVDGSTLQGFTGLKRYLSQDPQRPKFLRTICGKFVGFALGRALIPSDQALIDHVMADLAANHWSSSTLVLDVLTSPEFTHRRDDLDASTTSSTPARSTP